MSAPGRERLYEDWEHFLAARGGERRSILPLGEGYEDDLSGCSAQASRTHVGQ